MTQTYEPEVEAALRLLPAWFVPRMMMDNFRFGLLVQGGIIIHICCIERVRLGASDTVWIDVELFQPAPSYRRHFDVTGFKNLYAPSTRTDASINAAHVICAFETGDT